MSVENWIDEIAKAFAVSNGKGGTVRSYLAYSRNQFPDKIADYPAAISYPTDMRAMIYADAKYELWNGRTDFHLFPDVGKKNIPDLMLYFARIINAAASNLTLSNKVQYFQLRTEGGPGIQGPVELSYGGEEPHLGLVAYWQVKVDSTVTLS